MTSLKKIVTICILCLNFFVLSLQASNEPSILRLEFRSGSISYFELSSKPVLLFDTDSIVIRSSVFSIVMYNYNTIRNVCFVDNTNAVVKNLKDKHINNFQFLDGVNVKVSGLNLSDKICIYSIDGRLLPADIERNSDHAIIHLNSFPKGIYIIKVGIQSYKIYKK